MPWYTVRIEQPQEGRTLFTVTEEPDGAEIVGLDSTPAVLAILHAPNPAEAALLAWQRGQAEVEAISKGAPVYKGSDLMRLLDGLGVKSLDGSTDTRPPSGSDPSSES